jgi:hypothetical protein
MWNLWCRNTHTTGYLRSSLSVSFHHYSIFRFITLPLTLHNVAQWFAAFFSMEAPIKLLLVSWRTPTHENENKTQSSWYCTDINPVLPIARQDSCDILRDIWNFFYGISEFLFIYSFIPQFLTEPLTIMCGTMVWQHWCSCWQQCYIQCLKEQFLRNVGLRISSYVHVCPL